MIASSEGGVNIEDVAEKNPEAIHKFPIDIHEGLSLAKAKEAATKLGINASKVDEVAQIFVNLYKMFESKDATMVEINPFAEDSNGTCKHLRQSLSNTNTQIKLSSMSFIMSRFLLGCQAPL